MLTLAEFSQKYVRPAAHDLVRRDAREAGLDEAETAKLIEQYDRDPIAYAVATRGDWFD